MKYEKSKRNRDFTQDYLELEDPMYGMYKPEFYKGEEFINNTELHPEIRKMIYSTLPEGNDARFTL